MKNNPHMLMIRCSTGGDDKARRRPLASGTAALEFVIVLPVLIVIVIGATDLSRALHYGNILSNAARNGASYAATHQVTDFTYDSWESLTIDRATQEAANLPDFDGDLLEVSVSLTTEADGSQRAHVIARYPFELLFDWPGWPDVLMLEHGVSMRSYR